MNSRVRLMLYVVVVCWIVTAAAYFGVSNTRRWYPDVVGFFAVLSAVITLVVAARPSTVWAYRIGGTMAIGTLMLRSVSVLMGLFLFVDIDAIWISVSSLAATTMICILYWTWWLDEVKAWHEAHKRIDRRRRDLE